MFCRLPRQHTPILSSVCKNVGSTMAQRLTKTLLCHSRSGKEPGRVARAAYESMLQDSSKTAAGCEFITLESARQGLLERNLTVKELLVGKDIAIVGAGVAGLNAALKLQGALSREGLDKKYQNNVRIFEASSETGEALFPLFLPCVHS